MIKDKMEKFALDRHINDYADLDMDTVRRQYKTSVKHVRDLKIALNHKMDLLYDAFVRKDPARPLYNY